MSEKDAILAQVVALMKEGNVLSAEPRSPVSDIEIDAIGRELGVVLPPSYRQFLKFCGAGRVGTVDVFGLPRNHLWGDLVLMNQLVQEHELPSYIRFASDWTGRDYYFDTKEHGGDSEWPVVVIDAPESPRQIANSFLDFLGKLVQGPITIELERYAAASRKVNGRA